MFNKSKIILGVFSSVYLLKNYYYAETIKYKEYNSILYSWGSNIFGQLGLGNNNNEYSPKLVEFFNNIEIKDIFIGEKNSAIIDKEGNLYLWGNSTEGINLNHNKSLNNKNLPILVNTDIKFKKVSIGNKHCGAISEDNKLYLWGNKEYNKLITNEKEKKLDLRKIKSFENRESPFLDHLKEVENLEVKDIFCNNDFTIIISNKKVYSIGNSNNGCLGCPEREKLSLFEIKELSDKNIIEIEGGNEFLIAKSKDGKLYSWGSNFYNQLGNSNEFYKSNPEIIPNLNNIKKVSCGENFCLSLNNLGEIYSWGQGNKGQLGHGKNCDVPIPKKINFSEKIKDISVGLFHSGILTEKNNLYLFGKGNEGQLGLGDENISPLAFHNNPTELNYFKLNNLFIEKIKCGGYHNFALAGDLK